MELAQLRKECEELKKRLRELEAAEEPEELTTCQKILRCFTELGLYPTLVSIDPDVSIGVSFSQEVLSRLEELQATLEVAKQPIPTPGLSYADQLREDLLSKSTREIKERLDKAALPESIPASDPGVHEVKLSNGQVLYIEEDGDNRELHINYWYEPSRAFGSVPHKAPLATFSADITVKCYRRVDVEPLFKDLIRKSTGTKEPKLESYLE